jgi:hypothetical protein
MKKPKMVYKLSLKMERRFIDLCSKLPIVWHETTPKKFSCEAGCSCCCSTTWFTPQEYEELPNDIKKDVRILNGGFIAPKPFCTDDKGDFGCIFFKRSPFKHHCTIHNNSPLRCRMYPYHPVIDLKKCAIVIMAYPFIHYNPYEKPRLTSPKHRCFGLGQGKDVSKSVEQMSRVFLTNLFEEHSESRYLYVRDSDAIVDYDSIAAYKHPEYFSWSDVVMHDMYKML